MATGLDRIIERIREDAQRRADETVETARADAEKLLAEAATPDAEYFEVLLHLLQKNAAPGKAEMRFAAKDLARKPADFDRKVSEIPGAQITVSPVPAQIEDGFLLVYDGIDINCTFDALFSAQADELSDIAGRVLFG